MFREMNKKRQPCRICKHKPGFKHYCKSCSRWFCPVCVRPGCHPCDQMADGSSVGAMSSTTEAPTVMQDAFDHTELQPGTRVLVRYKPIGHIEIANCNSWSMNVSFCGASRGIFSSLLPTSIFVSNKVSGGLSFGCCETAGTRIVRMILAVPSSTTFTWHLMYGNSLS